MASLGQYQSFALIAYRAIATQLSNTNKQIQAGCDGDSCNKILYVAKNLNDTVFAYSVDCINVDGLLEADIIKMCNWITRNLNFTTTPIPQLVETYLNSPYDFNQYDFNPNDFA